MKITMLLINGMIFYSSLLISQNQNNVWYFGNRAGLDFNTATPTVITNSNLHVWDNSAAVSDTNGNILFYSNGQTVLNKNHMLMSNGSGLLGNSSGGHAAYAVKKPGNNNEYYLFTLTNFAGSNGLRYNVIDMNANGGLGEVTSIKNVVLLSQASEKITAIPHQNNKDIWIITHPWNSSSFHSFLLTENGLNTTPVISNVGSIHTGGFPNGYNAMGQMVASVAGNKVACALYMGNYEVFDFDQSTGTLSNALIISGFSNAFGIAFSPNGNYIYTTRWNSQGVINSFDISSNNIQTVMASQTTVGVATAPNGSYKTGYLQLAPNGQIYIAKMESNYLASIQNPDNFSTPSFVDNSVYLSGRKSLAGLPSFVVHLAYVEDDDEPRDSIIPENIGGLDIEQKSGVITVNDTFSKELPINEIGIIENPADSIIGSDNSFYKNNMVQVYPNPTQDYLNFEGLNKSSTLRVFNINGQLVLESLIFEGVNSIDVKHLPNGVYVYKLYFKDAIGEGKFIKN